MAEVDCDMGEGYVTEEDESADTEQLKKAGKRVRVDTYSLFNFLTLALIYVSLRF